MLNPERGDSIQNLLLFSPASVFLMQQQGGKSSILLDCREICPPCCCSSKLWLLGESVLPFEMYVFQAPSDREEVCEGILVCLRKRLDDSVRMLSSGTCPATHVHLDMNMVPQHGVPRE
jgi:hypothetical protein